MLRSHRRRNSSLHLRAPTHWWHSSPLLRQTRRAHNTTTRPSLLHQPAMRSLPLSTPTKPSSRRHTIPDPPHNRMPPLQNRNLPDLQRPIRKALTHLYSPQHRPYPPTRLAPRLQCRISLKTLPKMHPVDPIDRSMQPHEMYNLRPRILLRLPLTLGTAARLSSVPRPRLRLRRRGL